MVLNRGVSSGCYCHCEWSAVDAKSDFKLETGQGLNNNFWFFLQIEQSALQTMQVCCGFDSCRQRPRGVAVDFCPKQSGWLINQLGNPNFFAMHQLQSRGQPGSSELRNIYLTNLAAGLEGRLPVQVLPVDVALQNMLGHLLRKKTWRDFFIMMESSSTELKRAWATKLPTLPNERGQQSCQQCPALSSDWYIHGIYMIYTWCIHGIYQVCQGFKFE